LKLLPSSVLALICLVACGPPGGEDDDDDTPCQPQGAETCDNGRDDDCDGMYDCDDGDCVAAPACESCIPVAEVCDDELDNDCDAIADCDDADCEGHPACPDGCGAIATPTGELALPDGDCPEDESQPCEGFEDTVAAAGFSAGQTLNDLGDLLGICVNMEHSWMRDLVIYAECPNHTRVMLVDFAGHVGGEVFLGEPVDADDVGPTPGVGWDYCWTPTATDLPWIDYADAHPGEHTLHAGDYRSSQPLDAFVGCPLNGDWTLRVEDRWGVDNGFIFEWSVRFDPSIVEDCEDWPGG